MYGFGHQLRKLSGDFAQSAVAESETAATIQAVSDTLFREFENRGGAKTVLSLESAEWKKAKYQILDRTREVLRKMRQKRDVYHFSTVLNLRERLVAKEKLQAVEGRDAEAIDGMIRVFKERECLESKSMDLVDEGWLAQDVSRTGELPENIQCIAYPATCQYVILPHAHVRYE
jgi:hypothetical protein